MKAKAFKVEIDKIGRVIKIIGQKIPTTSDEDFLEMRRVWNAQSQRKDPPYTKKSKLLACGGEK